jgi:hypothetical protein
MTVVIFIVWGLVVDSAGRGSANRGDAHLTA